MKRHIYFQTACRTSLRSTFGVCLCSSLLFCFSLHLASRMEAKNTILTDAASSEVSGCQSMPCCWTLTFLPSVSHRTFWQSKADFRSFDYTSWIIHTPCTFILQGPGVGWLDLREYSFCQTVAGIPGNNIQYIITIISSIILMWCWTQCSWNHLDISRTAFLLMILMISGFYVSVYATWFWGPFVNGLGPNWDISTISTIDDRVGQDILCGPFLTSTPSDNHPKTYWLHSGWAPLTGRLLWDSKLDQRDGSFGNVFFHWNELMRNKPHSCWICLHLISIVFSFLQFLGVSRGNKTWFAYVRVDLNFMQMRSGKRSRNVMRHSQNVLQGRLHRHPYIFPLHLLE